MRILTRNVAILLSWVLCVSIFVPFPAVLASNSNNDVETIEQSLLDSHHQTRTVPGKLLVKYKTQPSVYHDGSIQLFSADEYEYEMLSFSPQDNLQDQMAKLMSDPAVAYVEPVYVAAIASLPERTVSQAVYVNETNMDYMESWGLAVTEVVYAQQQTTEEQRDQITVAVLDTGADLDHPDLADSLVDGANFIDGEEAADPQDYNGHGTHVAGIVGAKAAAVDGYSGVAPGVNIMPIKVLGDNGVGTSVDVIEGIAYAIEQGVDIINLSLGVYGDSTLLHEAIQAAVAEGIIVVAAAGNDSNHWIDGEEGQFDGSGDTERYMTWTAYPAQYPEVISVGALEQLVSMELTLADFSNVGKIDLVAPGVNIYSTSIDDDYAADYAVMHGTSQATPFVSGIFALLKAYNPELTASELIWMMKYAAELPDWEDEYYAYRYPMLPTNTLLVSGLIEDYQVYGYGLVNARLPFELPRFKLEADTSLFVNDREVIIDVTSVDIAGNVVEPTDTVNIIMSNRVEEEGMILYEWIDSPESVDLIGGHGQITLTLPSDDVYYYDIYADSELPYAGSNRIELVNKPAKPQASLASGSYAGSQTVALTTNTPDAEIWYWLEDAEYITIAPYQQPLTIDQDSYLYAFSKKNDVSSNGIEYFYEILAPAPTPTPTPTPPNNGNGGGGGGLIIITPIIPPAAPEPSAEQQLIPGDDGGLLLNVTPDAKKLLEQIALSADSKIEIDATSEESVDQISVTIAREVVEEALKKNTKISIMSKDIQLVLPSGFIANEEEADSLRLDIDQVLSSSAYIASATQSLVSDIYDFSLFSGDRVQSTFRKPVTITFHVKRDAGEDEKTYVYYWNELTNKWEFVGGRMTADGLSAELQHFSKYAVLRMDNEFEDIKGHWAEREIGAMVARQIVYGVSEKSFEPARSITRAEFSVLMARALKLSAEGGSNNSFVDVPADAWYRDAVYAIAKAGIIQGVSADRFAPGDPLTREQLAMMLLKAYYYLTGQQGSDMAVTQEVKFDDEGSISSWARESVRLIASLGLMSGVDDNVFAPKQVTSRDQAVVVLYRLLKSME